MPVYQYKARSRSGEIVTGSVTAADEDQLARALHDKDIFLTSAKETSQGKLGSGSGRALSRNDLVAFCYQVQTIMAAGVSIIEGLESLSDESNSPRLQALLQKLIDDIRQGASISDALAQHPQTFPTILISLVKSGEATGRVDVALGHCGDYLQWWNNTRSAMLQATIYPGLLMTAVGGLLILMVTFLVPRMTKLFARTSESMPLPTQVLVNISDFLRTYAIHLGIGALIVVAGVVMYSRTREGRYHIDSMKFRLPLLGSLMRKICAARFTYTLSALHKAGVSIIDAMSIAGATVGNVAMMRAVEQARDGVREGRSISEALRETSQFQPLVSKMIALGEKTGSLDTTLDRVNEFYDREVMQSVKSMLTVIEPVMIAVAGLLVGFILLCCFLPLFKLISAVRT